MARGQAAQQGATGARNFRARYGLSPVDPIRDLLAVAEDRCGVPVAVLPRLDGDLAGGYYRRGDRRVIVLNAEDIVPRMRFTLAHELGHHYFRHLDRVPELRDGIRDTREGLRYAYDWWEVQANAFAAELLIPEPAVARWDSEREVVGVGLDAVADLASRFGTSLIAAAIRLETAGLLPDAASLERLKDDIAAGYGDALMRSAPPFEDGLSAARECAPRIPPALRTSKLAAVAGGRRSVRDAAVQLGRDPQAAAATMAALGLLPPA